MGERVVPNLVALIVDALQQSSIVLSREPNQKEGGLYVLLAKYVENARREVRIGAIVERDCDLMRFAPVGDQLVGRGELRVGFGNDEPALVVVSNCTLAVARTPHDAQDLALSIDRDILARGDYREPGSVGPHRVVPYLPQGA